MILPDVNVLIGAFRTDAKDHATCKPWLDRTIATDAPFGISTLVLAAVIRVTTTPNVFAIPSLLDTAFGFCDDLRTQPNCALIEPGERHWKIFEDLCTATQIKGRHLTDVWYAALAIEHGCTWISLDKGFARFPGLNWKQPN